VLDCDCMCQKITIIKS